LVDVERLVIANDQGAEPGSLAPEPGVANPAASETSLDTGGPGPRGQVALSASEPAPEQSALPGDSSSFGEPRDSTLESTGFDPVSPEQVLDSDAPRVTGDRPNTEAESREATRAPTTEDRTAVRAVASTITDHGPRTTDHGPPSTEHRAPRAQRAFLPPAAAPELLGRLAARLGKEEHVAVRLRLDPPSLGEVHVQIEAGKDGVHVRIVAQSQEACALLADGELRLKAELQRQDLTLESFSTTVGEGAVGDGSAGRDQGPTTKNQRPMISTQRSPADELGPRSDAYAGQNAGVGPWSLVLGRLDVHA
jgi:flagellar hook-length control protein FliK